jgi:hypothetical protein
VAGLKEEVEVKLVTRGLKGPEAHAHGTAAKKSTMKRSFYFLMMTCGWDDFLRCIYFLTGSPSLLSCPPVHICVLYMFSQSLPPAPCKSQALGVSHQCGVSAI